MSEQRRYNFIYRQLVESEDDVIGLVAYGIYKQHKIEFIRSFKEKNDKDPEDRDCDTFYLTSTTPDQLRKYRDQAENLFSSLVASTTNEEIQRFEQEMLKTYESKIDDSVKKSMPTTMKSFWLGVLGSFIATLVMVGISVLFYFYGATSDKKLRDTVEQIVEEQVSTKNDSIK